MPPVRVNIGIKQTFDGTQPLDLRSQGINLVYLPDYITVSKADALFSNMLDRDILRQHSYHNRFKVQITPHRLTYAHVPDRTRYRLIGKDLHSRPDPWFTEQFESLIELPGVAAPNAAICNGYRYNNDDYIATHVDDEKFLVRDNSTYWSDATVCTITLLRDPLKPMFYHAANPTTPESGVSIMARHGSLLIQGSVLHHVPKIRGDGHVGRVSITMRKLYDSCSHYNCARVTCPYNEGPSNYVYYSLSQEPDATEPPMHSLVKITAKIKPRTEKPQIRIKAKLKVKSSDT
jgi:hypothetical protein